MEKKIMEEKKGLSFNVLDHVLASRHEVVKPDEAKQVLERFHAEPEDFPYIQLSDPVVREIGAKAGELVKITRKSQSAGEVVYYRFVVEG